jgi:streptogramin lyase
MFVINRLAAILLSLGGLVTAAEKPVQKAGIKTPGIQIPFARLKAEQEFAVAGGARWVIVSAQTAIVAGKADASVARIDLRTDKPGDPLSDIGQPCAGAVEAFQSFWIGDCAKGQLVRVNSKDGKVATRVSTGIAKVPAGIAATADSVWVLSDAKATLTRIDPDTNNVVSELRLPAGCNSLLSAESSLWASCPAENRVLRISTTTNQVENRIEVAAGPQSLAAGEGSLWVLCRKDGKVDRIDPKTNKVAKSIELTVPDVEGAITFGGGSLWVTMSGFPLTRIDPLADKERVAQQFAGEGGGAVQFGSGFVLLVNSRQGTLWKLDPKRITATTAE